jgi:hypothetical protein
VFGIPSDSCLDIGNHVADIDRCCQRDGHGFLSRKTVFSQRRVHTFVR